MFDQFGCRVGISGDTVIFSAPKNDVNGNIDQGSAYIFTRGGTTWTQRQKLTAGDGAAGKTYILSVRSKRYSLTAQIVTANENLTDVNFTAQ